jgi:putative transcriptional regulator
VGATRTALSVTLLAACLGLYTVGPATRAIDARLSMQLVPGVVRELAAGKLLIAERGLPDPNFSQTVILLIEYREDGAVGVVINRKTDVPLARAFPKLNRVPEAARIYAGGPVATTRMLGLLRARTATPNVRHIVSDVYLAAEREPLEGLIASGADPNRFRVYFGYAGWGPGQLQREAIEGAWHVVPGDAAIVFDPEPESIWRREIRRAEGLLAHAPLIIVGRSEPNS